MNGEVNECGSRRRSFVVQTRLQTKQNCLKRLWSASLADRYLEDNLILELWIPSAPSVLHTGKGHFIVCTKRLKVQPL